MKQLNEESERRVLHVYWHGYAF